MRLEAENERRRAARELARAALERGEPLAWFEELYAQSDAALVPWAEMTPNPNFVSWAEREKLAGSGRRALKVGAGFGDDAEALARLAFEVDAFDIAPSAVAAARARFPGTAVTYRVADVLDLPAEWERAFDFVLEAYTLQVLPPELRGPAADSIAATVAAGGALLVISRGRDEAEPEGEMPWPLTPAELRELFAAALELVAFEDYSDDEEPPVRRLRALFRR